MKLLLENWREYLNETEEEVIDTLRIFDFDETIAHTRSSTRVTAPDGSQAVLSNQKEFEDYMTAAAEKEGLDAFDPVEGLMAKGYEIDLSDFSQVIEPEEITVVTDQLRQNPHIKRVEYYEDSDKNIQDVMNHICPDKLAELIIYKVIKSEKGYSLQYIGC